MDAEYLAGIYQKYVETEMETPTCLHDAVFSRHDGSAELPSVYSAIVAGVIQQNIQ